MTPREQAQVLAHSIWALELALDEFDTGHTLDRQRTEEQLKELRRVRHETITAERLTGVGNFGDILLAI